MYNTFFINKVLEFYVVYSEFFIKQIYYFNSPRIVVGCGLCLVFKCWIRWCNENMERKYPVIKRNLNVKIGTLLYADGNWKINLKSL
jgi:hypothetical protein